MSIEWDSVNACRSYFGSAQGALRDDVTALGRRSGWTRFLAVPVGISLALVEVVKTIATIGEAIFKGLANIFGSPFSDEFEFRRGFVFLGGETLGAVAAGIWNIGVCLILAPVVITINPARERP